MPTVEEMLKSLLEQQQAMTSRMEEQNRQITEQQELLGRMATRFDNFEKGNLDTPHSVSVMGRKGESPSKDDGNDFGGHKHALHFNPKVEFPIFDGSNARNWIKKCVKYFSLCKISEDQKIDLASMYMVGKAEVWFSSYTMTRRNVSWEDFVVDVCVRFKDEMGSRVVEEFNKLQQWGSLDDYVDKFEELRALLLINNSLLPDDHFLDSFVGGLQPQLKSFVRAFRPKTLSHAIEYARCQEETIQALKTQTKPTTTFTQPKPSYSKPVFSNQKPLLPTPSRVPFTSITNTHQNSNTKQFPRFIPAAERAEKIAKGLCYYCDKPFDRGHKCATTSTQLFLVEVPGADMQVGDGGDVPGEEIAIGQTDENRSWPVGPCISVSALHGSHSFQTMRVTGYYNQKPLHILIDSGSTHNFLDIGTARRLECGIEGITSQAVAVADGNSLQCQHICRQFQWQLHRASFTSDVLLISLGGCDMVLGVQWLSTLGTVKWNFKDLKMEFDYKGKTHVLRGMTAGVSLVAGRQLPRVLHNSIQLCLLQHVPASSEQALVRCHAMETNNHNPDISALLAEFQDIFQEPSALPPSRGIFDHRIPLIPDARPVNLRPYRYPLRQKDIIEQLVQQMLDSGVIQPSCSSFASPVVLVGKKDGSWRLCVDYRELNKLTIRDKFPIPVVEELIDELAGATIFSKIDLRSGYHQLRLYEPDIHKTAFKTHNGHYEFLVMPFGLTNAPATFQGLMNHVFKPFLRKSVLVFFDDILIYSPCLSTHLVHIREVLLTMRANSLLAKESKCAFGVAKVEYLGHFISGEGVSTDPSKVKAVQEWPPPKTVKELQSFLGLAGYYRKFVRNYALISRPLTTLLKKGSFQWSAEAEGAFTRLKTALSTAPVLAVPDFSKIFVVETDASVSGIGAVLMQDHHPLAFISRALGPKWQRLSVYEKELLAVVFAVQKWEQYLLHQPFIIKTDQKSLKWLLENKISTPFQQFWLSKLMGYSYEIQYKSGKENLAADALSRVPGADILCMAISSIESHLIDDIKASWQLDPILKQRLLHLQQGLQIPHFSLVDGLLRRHGKLVIGPDEALKRKLLEWGHSSSVGGHSGRDATLRRLKSLFSWPGLNKYVSSFIRACPICQTCKYDTAASPGLLQPLPIPSEVWKDVSMDFIEGLPKSMGKDVIFVVVDRLSKYAHFMVLSHPFTALEVAQTYLDHVFKLHGMPLSIVSDWDSVFLSQFWQALFSVQGVQLCLSSSYHPQTDGQTEVVNRCLETYLRCMCSHTPQDWCRWIPLAEWWYNTTFHTSTRLTPYEIVYSQPPPLHLPYLPGESSVAAVDRSLQLREQMIKELKLQLQKAQNRMKQLADKHRSDRIFAVGDWVLVKLQAYRQVSVQQRSNEKLSPKYFGPFQIEARVGQVAYKIRFPSSVQVHNVLHVSQLKLFKGPLPSSPHIPPWLHGQDSTSPPLPSLILERRIKKRRNAAAVQFLVQWEGSTAADATWEWADEFALRFPDFAL